MPFEAHRAGQAGGQDGGLAMNPIEAGLRRVDQAQQRHVVTGFAYGVIKKYGDDNGGVLVTNLAYCAFVSDRKSVV